jgi:hypothetical protein
MQAILRAPATRPGRYTPILEEMKLSRANVQPLFRKAFV